MTERIRTALTIATVAVLALGCAAAGPQPSAGTSAAPSVGGDKTGGGVGQNRLALTIVTGEGEAEEANAYAKAVADRSNGTIEIKVDNTTIAPTADYETNTIKHVAAGKADLGYVGARAFDLVGVQSFVALHAPFLIDNYALQEQVLTSDWGKALLDGTRGAGVTGLGYFQGPLRRPLGFTRELKMLSDYAGARIGIRDSTVTAATMRALGATPVVFEPNSIAGLDGMEVHMGLLVGSKYDIGAKGLTGNVMFAPRPGVVFANNGVFDALTAEQQAILRAAGDAMYAASVLSTATNGPSALATLCRRGLTIVQAPGGYALSKLRTAVQPVYDEIEKDPGTKATIDRIEALRDGSHPSDAVECSVGPDPVASVAPTMITSPLVGTYASSITLDELRSSPHLYDAGEANTENWGDLTLTFGADGRVSFTQRNSITSTETSGTYAIEGDIVRLTYTAGVNIGESFTARWSTFADGLTFERVAGDDLPTPYLIKSWTRQP
jgi:TRAP-type C4-dicarboxylate transport system substrate-binding protein